MAAELSPAVKAVLSNYKNLSLLEAQELLWLLSLEKVEPDQNIICKSVNGFLAAVSLFPQSYIRYYEAPAKDYRLFGWNPNKGEVTVKYNWSYYDDEGHFIKEEGFNYFTKEEFIRIWSC